MIKKLLLTLSFIVLTTIAFSGTTYAAQEGETIVISKELSNLNKLYIEGFITEEEFSKAKSILLNPVSDTTKKEEKKWWQFPDEEMEEEKRLKEKKKKKLTAAERRDLKKLEKLEKKELKEAKKAKKRIKKKKKLTAVERRDLERLEKAELKAAKEAEKERKREEEELARQTCKDNPEVKCPSIVLRTLKKINIFKKN